MKICISCLLLLFVLTLNSVESQLNRIEAQEMLDLHNEFRRFVRPSASNMLEMRWNRTLALIAQEYANKCLFVHNNQRTSQVNGEFDYVGENLYISWGMPNPHSSAVESWNEEKKDYVYGTGCIPQKVCGHYTQVIWWNSEYVGCGQATCSAVPGISSCKAENPCTLVVCNYGPGGNYVGREPFDLGTPCSSCPEEYICKNDLCAKPFSSKILDSDIPGSAKNIGIPAIIAIIVASVVVIGILIAAVIRWRKSRMPISV